MKKRKAADSRGIVVELLQCGGEELFELIAEIFTDVLQPQAEVPSNWKETRLKVRMKKGDAQLPENYRPIAIIPILYKLFSRIVSTRVRTVLMRAQSIDQAGFRP